MGAFEDYAAARNDFVSAHKALDTLAEEIGYVAAALKANREAFMFANMAGSFPSKGAAKQLASAVDGQKWKSAAQINQMLAQWHAARDALDRVWNSLPKEQREALQPPPGPALKPSQRR
ncbi:MAG TPA: hypothetical protein VG271_14290 [Beijerinckiaceae bacterium]|nr:hypothetical protein [Beijerinckiaceae bacterium]